MTELWLKFKDEEGKPKRVLVEGEKFVIGRTPDNNLGITRGNVSRKHVQIDRFADIFIVSDCGSSNGTKINGAELKDPVAFQNGDKLLLGDDVEIEAEIISDTPAAGTPEAEAGAAGTPDGTGAAGDASVGAGASSAAGAAAGGGSSIPTALFIIVPIFGFLFLGVIGVGLYVLSDSGPTVASRNTDFVYTKPSEDPDTLDEPDNTNKSKGTSTPKPPSGSNSSPSNSSESITPTPVEADLTPTPKVSGDSEKIEIASTSFLRRIAANDTKAFLTSKQISVVSNKINQFKNSTALAENLKNAKKNSSQIEQLANSKSLKPQFLTTAALAKLGNQQGDVAKTAQDMLETLSNLRASLGNELADDTILIIAAYDQGAAGKNLVMRDTVARLTNKFPTVSSRTVRTIWFLHDNSQLTDAEFDMALKFLAIGTITQNPKDFNVQSDAVVFN